MQNITYIRWVLILALAALNPEKNYSQVVIGGGTLMDRLY